MLLVEQELLILQVASFNVYPVLVHGTLIKKAKVEGLS
jgi:hypothetical protein